MWSQEKTFAYLKTILTQHVNALSLGTRIKIGQCREKILSSTMPPANILPGVLTGNPHIRTSLTLVWNTLVWQWTRPRIEDCYKLVRRGSALCWLSVCHVNDASMHTSATPFPPEANLPTWMGSYPQAMHVLQNPRAYENQGPQKQ